MSKSFRFWVRCHTVGLLCGLLIVNPVWAGRGLRCWLGHNQPNRSCPTEAQAACAQTVACGPAADSNAGDHQAAEAAAIGQIVEPAPLNPAPANPTPVAPAAPAPAVVPEPKQSSSSPILSPAGDDIARSTLPVSTEHQASLPEQNVVPPSPSVAQPSIPQSRFLQPSVPQAEPSAATDPGLLPASPFDQPLPAEPAPTPPSSEEDNIFGAPAKKEANTDANNASAAAVIEDPFAPAAPTTPDASQPNVPAAVDDLFGSLSTPDVKAAESSEAENPFAPATPQATEPASVSEDPFAPLPTVPATPLVPAASANVDELFGAAATPEARPNTAAPNQNPSATERDDFLDLLTTAPAEQPAPAVPAGATETTDEAKENANPTPVEKSDDDQANVIEPADPLAKSPLRLWRDNTGNFEVTGRLAEVHPDRVRLLKENGRFTTVPLRRLSTEDRKYVELTIARIQLDQTRLITAE